MKQSENGLISIFSRHEGRGVSEVLSRQLHELTIKGAKLNIRQEFENDIPIVFSVPMFYILSQKRIGGFR